MKFHHLPLGARFLFRETVFCKISPLKATNESDATQKLIPRSADVTALDKAGEVIPDRLPEQMSGTHVETHIRKFLAHCEGALIAVDPQLSESQHTQLQQAIGAAGQELLAQLALGR